jgi:glucokinase
MSEPETVALGIDIGGTTVKLGLVDVTGCVLGRRSFAYTSVPSFSALTDRLVSDMREMEREAQRITSWIGVAAPGHAQAGDGLMVDGTANVPLLHNRSLAAALRERLGLPVTTVNDGTAAALGELHFGSGRGRKRFVVVTLGTGVGGGVVIDGHVITGDDGEPPEIGAMVLRAAVASPRTLEEFSCAAGFAAAYERGGGLQRLSPEDIFARAAIGDEPAIQAIDDTCRRIAQALGTLINTLNLNACLVGGGIAGAGEALLEPIRRHLPEFTWPYLLSRARVELAATGRDAGLLGAASLTLGLSATAGHAG